MWSFCWCHTVIPNNEFISFSPRAKFEVEEDVVPDFVDAAGDHRRRHLTDSHLLMVQGEGLLQGVIAHLVDLLYFARVFLLLGLLWGRGPLL